MRRLRCGDMPAARSVIAAIQESRDDIAGVAGFALDVASPTTVGLGDSFVGGFLSVCSRKGARS